MVEIYWFQLFIHAHIVINDLGEQRESAVTELKRMRGFTLVELMITLAIFAILVTVAAPNMSSFIKKRAVRSTADELLLSLVYARSEALKTGRDIYVLPSAGGWNAGWCVTASTGCADPAGLLQSFEPSGKTVVFHNTANFNLSNKLAFNGKGALSSVSLSTGATFTLSDSSLPESDKRCITLKKTGRAAFAACS